ncbi:MAG TPA: prolipoprotein diacylglyceryl transferase family protein [Candidatus Limnocylindrales bacterium]|nr:prolipoprotein diacylglyceryl transferase family protein [Candidatus Limnocylindrales bacterium]
MTSLAVIELSFDPLMRLGDVEVRVATVMLAGILLAGLLLAARIGRLTPQVSPFVPPPSLRPDDIPFLVLGIVPGAVIGGRLEYVLIHLDYYAVKPAEIVDPAQGGLALGLAVVGGILGGVAIARLVGAPAGRWMHAMALPLLFVLAAGKLATVLAGDGQGAPTDAWWATAYAGPGPWGSLAPEVPSHPSQVYEAIATTAVLAVVGLALRAGIFGRRDGSALLAGVALWALGRGIVAVTWRDAAVVGPLVAEHLVLVAVIGVCVAGLIRLRLVGHPEAILHRG